MLTTLLAVERQVTRDTSDQADLVGALAAADQAKDILLTTSVAALDEQAVWAFNRARPNDPLVALYPPDGTFASELTYAPVGGDDEAASTARELGGYLTSDDGQKAVAAVGLWNVAEGASSVLVDEAGVSPEGAAGEVAAPDADTLDAVASGWGRMRNPGSYLTAIDVSGSMGEAVAGVGRTKLQVAQEAAVGGIGLIGQSAEFGLGEFSTRIDGDRDHRELVPVGEIDADYKGGTHFEALVHAVEGLIPRDDTGLRDTALAAFRSAQEKYRPDELNAVVLITDGRNADAGSVTLSELPDALGAEQDDERPIRF